MTTQQTLLTWSPVPARWMNNGRGPFGVPQGLGTSSSNLHREQNRAHSPHDTQSDTVTQMEHTVTQWHKWNTQWHSWNIRPCATQLEVLTSVDSSYIAHTLKTRTNTHTYTHYKDTDCMCVCVCHSAPKWKHTTHAPVPPCNQSVNHWISECPHSKVLGPRRSNVALVQMVHAIKQEELVRVYSWMIKLLTRRTFWRLTSGEQL